MPRFKQRFTLITPRFHSLYEILDVAKACDAVVFLLCPHTGMSAHGELILSSVLAQGLPTDPLLLLSNTDEVPAKKLSDVKRLLIKTLDRLLPVEKIHTVDSPAEALNLLRTLGGQKQKRNLMRERRAHLMAESVEFRPDEADVSKGTLLLSGGICLLTYGTSSVISNASLV
jgi:pre-rRNA-processing protein TSR1